MTAWNSKTMLHSIWLDPLWELNFIDLFWKILRKFLESLKNNYMLILSSFDTLFQLLPLRHYIFDLGGRSQGHGIYAQPGTCNLQGKCLVQVTSFIGPCCTDLSVNITMYSCNKWMSVQVIFTLECTSPVSDEKLSCN